ncbi:MAG: 2-C-methyl-D-erythritol 2,4-cyclodiphosphate synthase [Bordetella sp.]|nr:MAG: 2-C-methyl-D-erythritol 2,4-cyclodiphosphate synthase [Bordetella sp.]
MAINDCNFRIGQGYDIHALISGYPLIIGGINIPHKKGLFGHSDGDVLLHAIIDALFGAAGLDDIGYHFSDNDSQYKNINSRVLLKRTFEKITLNNFKIINIDSTICIESPKIQPYTILMKNAISNDLQINPNQINIKVKTNEKFGHVGREESVVATAIILLKHLV